MTKIISIHSFRGGTGKSNTTANLAALLAAEGKRVGVVDTDILSPGIHVLFGLEQAQTLLTLNEYLWGRCDIEQAAHDVTASLDAEVSGKIFLVPSSISAGEIARILREGYDVGLLNDGIAELAKKLSLDVVLIDTHPGLNEETLFSIAISDVLLLILRPDQQDFQGTSVTVEIARKLNVARMLLVVNKSPSVLDPAALKTRVEKLYDCDVAAVLPHSDDLMVLASAGVFVLRHPDHEVTSGLKRIAARIMA